MLAPLPLLTAAAPTPSTLAPLHFHCGASAPKAAALSLHSDAKKVKKASKGEGKRVISFRKHAQESTRRPNSFLASPARAGYAAAYVSVLLSLLLFAPSSAAAQGRKRRSASKPQAGAPSQKKAAPDGKGEGVANVHAKDGRVPVHVERVETTEGPVVFATLGEFPSDLNEIGQQFLSQEFFWHFASSTLGLEEFDPKAATLKVAMRPREKENQREGYFTFGNVSGHMLVVVESRHVYVACALTKAAVPQMLARAARAASGEAAAE